MEAFWILLACGRLPPSPAPALPTLEWSQLAVGDTKAQDEAAWAGSSAVWTLGVVGDGWEGKARSPQLPTACTHPTQTQPATDLCPVQ